MDTPKGVQVVPLLILKLQLFDNLIIFMILDLFIVYLIILIVLVFEFMGQRRKIPHKVSYHLTG